MMKYLLYIIFLFIIFSCSSGKHAVSLAGDETISDSTEYELVTFEPDFNNWFITNRKPIWYHSHNYYRQWNSLYVREWNSRVVGLSSDRPFDFLIEYSFEIDYGKELDHELFWYFKFMEEKYDVILFVN